MRVKAGSFTAPVNTALEPYRRVKMTGGYLAYAGASDEDIGTLERRVVTGDTVVAVVPRMVEGTIKMCAAGSFSAEANLYAAADGKVDDVANEMFIGRAVTAATGDGSIVEVQRYAKSNQVDALGAIDGNVVIDDDFIGDYPAAATALDGQTWTKVETNGLGVISSDEANGVLKFSFDAVAEAATATLFFENSPFDIDKAPIFECRLAVFDKGDAAALDIDFGLASDDHATDFEAIAAFAAFHLDGNDLSVKCHSDDGTTDTAAVDSTVDLVDDTYANFKIDLTDKADVKFYINGTRVCGGTTFDISAYTGALTPIVMVEKTSDDTTADVRVDRIRVQGQRN